MGSAKWFSGRLLFKDGVLREPARALLREVWLESVGGKFGDECWPFPGGKANPEGYRYVDWKDSATRMAHRLVFEVFHGPIPPKHFVLHSCDNPPCSNPLHLSAGTSAQNSREMHERGRANNGQAAKTHCKRGHAFTPENTYLYRGKTRICKSCSRERGKLSARKRRAELKALGG